MSRTNKRQADRRDDNERAIIDYLVAGGATVVQGGPLDLIVALRGVTFLIEVKNPALPPSERKLKPSQVEFLATWPGLARVVMTNEEAGDFVFGYFKYFPPPCHHPEAEGRRPVGGSFEAGW